MIGIDDEKASFEQMKKEALKRMAKLGLSNEIYKAFSSENKVLCSDDGKIVETPECIKKAIKEWEDEYGNIVFHVIHSKLYFETYECISVSCYLDDWEYEKDIMRSNWVMSHSINMDKPSFTESGSIKILKTDGTLKRIG